MSSRNNVLSSDVEIKGPIKFSNDLVIEGSLEGEVISDGSLTVGENARVIGDIRPKSVVVSEILAWSTSTAKTKQHLSRKPVAMECPHCGHGQPESVLALSTSCRSCGRHYEIDAHARRKPRTGVEGEREAEKSPLALQVRRFLDRAGLAGAVAQLQRGLALTAERFSTLTSPIRKVMPSARDPRVVHCFGCGADHMASPTAESTSCPRCRTSISLTDIDVTELRTLAALTQGDVIVRRNVTLVGGTQCRNLTVLGKVLGRIDCSGVATFRHSGRVLGKIRCGKILVARGVSMEFAASVQADVIEVLGEARGEFTCEETLRLGKKGRVYGPVSTRALVVEPGGHLEGDLDLRPGVPTPGEETPPPAPPRTLTTTPEVEETNVPAPR